MGQKILEMIRRLFTPVEDFKLGDVNIPSSSSDTYSKNLDRIDSLFGFLHEKPKKNTEQVLKSQNSDVQVVNAPTKMREGEVALPNQEEIRKKHSEELSSINTALDENKAMENTDRSTVKHKIKEENQHSRKSIL